VARGAGPVGGASLSSEALIAAVADRDAALAKLAGRDLQIAGLKRQVAQLVAQVELLTERLSQDSNNSHRPPSSDGPGAGSGGGGRVKTSKSKRKRGGQKGHRGAHRQLLPPELVNTVIDHFPPVCLGCSASLSQCVDADARRHQQLDLHDHRPHVTEWRLHEVGCLDCGARTRAVYDGNLIPSSAFGPRLTAVVGLLTGVYHLSRRQAQRLLRELFGISVSLGAVSAMEGRASDALKTAYDEAVLEVEYAKVKHTDATSWLRSGALVSLWTLACSSATAYAIFSDGRRATILPFFGRRFGILVSDRASVFGFWAMALRQICWAHLVRKFISFSQRDGPAARFGHELLECSALVFEYWHGYKDGLLTREELATWIAPVRRHFERTLRAAAKADIARLSGSVTDMLAHQEALWTFVSNEGVEPTNNHAERELRAFVLWRKRSFGCQSDRGERFAERIMTVAHTARKQAKDILDFITRSLKAQLEGTTPPRLIAGQLA